MFGSLGCGEGYADAAEGMLPDTEGEWRLHHCVLWSLSNYHLRAARRCCCSKCGDEVQKKEASGCGGTQTKSATAK